MMIVRLSGHPLVQDSLTHPLESIFILTVLVLQVIDLGLEVLDFLLKLEDSLPNDFGI